MKLMTSPKAIPTIVHAMEMPATGPSGSPTFRGTVVTETVVTARVVVMVVDTLVGTPAMVVEVFVVRVTVVNGGVATAAPVGALVEFVVMMGSISNGFLGWQWL